MVKVGMDTDSPGNVAYSPFLPVGFPHIIFQHAGYDANSSFSVTGFSQLHDDGTGGVRDFPLFISPPPSLDSCVTPLFMQAVPLSNFKIFPSANCSSFETCPTSIDARKVPRMIRADGSYHLNLTHRSAHGSIGSLVDIASPGYFSTILVSVCTRSLFFID